MSKFKELCTELEAQIITAYEEGTTMEQAERLAGKFLFAQLAVSAELKKADLDARMRKTGVKSLRAALYLDAASKGERKPTEAALASILDSNEMISNEQNSYDKAEVEKAELERYYDIFTNGHIYFRGIAKGSFGG